MSRVGILALIVVVSVSALAGCGRRQPGSTAKPPARALLTPSQVGPDGLTGTDVSGVREVNIVAHRYTYDPDKVIVRKGEGVRLRLTSTDVTHGFGIDGLKINVKIEPGKVTIVQFTPGTGGDFPFYCTVDCGPGHKDMRGTLVVKP
jgi:heme/copper-type cytochrome/quinol oxidase subunit 2